MGIAYNTEVNTREEQKQGGHRIITQNYVGWMYIQIECVPLSDITQKSDEG